MHEQATIRRSFAAPWVPIRSGVFLAVWIGGAVLSRSGGTAGYLMLAGAGVGLGLAAALTNRRASRWGVGLGVALSVLCGGALGEFLWPRLVFSLFFSPMLLALLGAVLLAHLTLWLGADRPAIMPDSIAERRRRAGGDAASAEAASSAPISRRRWWMVGLWSLVALQAVGLVLHAGYTRLPCSWLDPVRVAAGCESALTVFGAEERIDAVTPTSQGVLVVTQAAQTVRVRRGDNGALLGAVTSLETDSPHSLKVSADGSIALIQGQDHQITAWRMADGARLQAISDALTLTDPEDFFRTFAVAPDGAIVATTAIREELVRLWRVSDGQPLGTLPTPFSNTLAFSPDGALLATLGAPGVTIWRVADGTLVRTFDTKLLADNVLSFSPDGTLLAIGGKAFDRDAAEQPENRPQNIQV